MITIFQQEIKDGLSDKLKGGSVAYLVEPKVIEVPKIKYEGRAVAGALDNGPLFYLDDILASVGWNNNDDVFDKLEFWQARLSPIDKPLNLNHINREIIGHTIGCIVVGNDLQPIPNDTPFDQLPDDIHILSNDVIYTAWEDKEYQKQIAEILDEVRQGLWMVSMECLFKGFDYAIISPDGENRVIARDKDSAFLTKHLRAYGGDGNYQNYKIGRLFRNMSFSGKGLVKKGANPNSIILNSSAKFQYSYANLGYLSSIASTSTMEINMDLETLKSKIDELEKVVASLNTENTSLKSKLDSAEREAVSAQAAKLTTVTSERDKAVADLGVANEKLKATEKLVADGVAKAESLQKDLDVAKNDLSAIKAEAVQKARVETLVKAGFKEEDAKAKVEEFKALDDKMFESVANMFLGYKDEKANTGGPSKPIKKVKGGKAEDETEDELEEVTPTEDKTVATASETETEGASAAEKARAELHEEVCNFILKTEKSK
jgi:hypothetical protein